MRLKRFLIIAITLIMVLVLASCGRDKEPEEETATAGPSFSSGEELYGFYDSILKQIEPMATKITSAYEAETGNEQLVSYNGFSNSCIDIYSFSEGATLEFVSDVLKPFYEDMRLEEAGTNEYRLTFTGTDLYTEEKFKGLEEIKFDPAKLCMSCIDYRNDEYYSFAEFACVGVNMYAGITPEYRLLVRCEDGEVKEFWYAENKVDNMNDLDDSIYSRTGLGESWLKEDDAEGGLYRISYCDGSTLTITGYYLNVDPETEEVSYLPGYKWTYTISE